MKTSIYMSLCLYTTVTARTGKVELSELESVRVVWSTGAVLNY